MVHPGFYELQELARLERILLSPNSCKLRTRSAKKPGPPKRAVRLRTDRPAIRVTLPRRCLAARKMAKRMHVQQLQLVMLVPLNLQRLQLWQRRRSVLITPIRRRLIAVASQRLKLRSFFQASSAHWILVSRTRLVKCRNCLSQRLMLLRIVYLFWNDFA